MGISVNSKKVNLFMEYFELLFKIEFLLFGFLGYNAFTFGRPIMTVFVLISTAMAGVILLYRIVNYKVYVKNIFLWLLLLFLCSFAVSLLANRSYGGLSEGIRAAAWMGMQYIILFLHNPHNTIEKDKREFSIVSWVFIIYMFIAVVISIVFLFLNKSFLFTVGSAETPIYIYAGLVWGRLWGVFTDPNYGSVMSVVAVLLSYYFICVCKKKWLTVLLSVNIVLQIIYIAFSDSRTGIVCMMFGFAVCAYFFLQKAFKAFKKPAVRQVLSVLCVFLIVVSCWLVPKFIKQGYNKTISYIHTQTEPSETDDVEIEELLLGREEDIENDFSNRRFDLWKSGIEIMKTSPIIGVSHFGLTNYAKANLPHTYLIDNTLGQFDNFHNAYINVLVGQGIIGFLIICVFTAVAAIYILSYIWKARNDLSAYVIVLLSVIIAVGCSTMFVSDVFYINSPCATMFWLTLGYAVHYVSNAKDANKNKERLP